MIYRLGKKAPRFDKRTLRLSKYIKALPPPPVSVDFTAKVTRPWGMMLNDSLGDCVCAAAGHMIEQWTFEAGKGIIPTDAEILRAYEVIGGYVPGDPSTDNGCDMLTALKTWRKSGIAGHKIGAFVALERGNVEEMHQAVALFGNAYIGVALPLDAQEEATWHIETETGNGTPGSWGGHAVPVMAYDPTIDTVISWGAKLNMTPGWYSFYSDEAYAVLSQDWIDGQGESPSGFDLAQLQADLQEVTA